MIRASFDRQLLYCREVLLTQLLLGVGESFLGSHAIGPHNNVCWARPDDVQLGRMFGPSCHGLRSMATREFPLK